MTRLDFAAVGRPRRTGAPAHLMRSIASLVAALAGALGLLLIGFVVFGSVSFADARWAFAAIAVLLVVWLTGLWWRWDAPDARNPHYERERRGF